MSSTRAAGTCPDVSISRVRRPPVKSPGSAGRSTPAFAAARPSRTAKAKSGTTKPVEAPVVLERVEQRSWLSQVGVPLTRL